MSLKVYDIADDGKPGVTLDFHVAARSDAPTTVPENNGGKTTNVESGSPPSTERPRRTASIFNRPLIWLLLSAFGLCALLVLSHLCQSVERPQHVSPLAARLDLSSPFYVPIDKILNTVSKVQEADDNENTVAAMMKAIAEFSNMLEVERDTALKQYVTRYTCFV